MIPAEAVEAAAKALYEVYPSLAIPGDESSAVPWESAHPARQYEDRKQARAALEAAAPYIRETVTEWAAAFRLTGEPYNFHRTREEAQAFVDDMSKQDVDMVVMTREVLPAQASEWAPYMLNNEGEK